MARSFNGTSQYLTVGAGTGPLSLTGNTVSISCVVKPGTLSSGGNGWICSKMGTASGSYAFWFGTTSGVAGDYKKLRFSADFGAGWADRSASNIVITTVGTWYRVGLVYDGSNSHFWVDGVLDSSPAVSGSFSAKGGAFTIGYEAGWGSQYLNGTVAELAVWGVALSAGEMRGLGVGEYAPSIRPASLLSYVPCGGHHGRNDVDAWKNNLTVTPSGSPTWADHPRVIYPGPSFAPIKATVASSTKYWTFARQAARIIGGGIGT